MLARQPHLSLRNPYCSSAHRGAIINGAREAQLMMLSGFALEMLEAAGRAPLDSRTAIGRAITQAS